MFPKSVAPERIRENWGTLNVKLTDENLTRLATLERTNSRFGPDPMEFS